MTEPRRAAELARAVDRLLAQVGHWTPARWSAAGGRRADRFHALAQRLADLEAEVTGRPALPVPRLPSDLVLPDQVKVLAADLIVAGPDDAVLATAVAEVADTARLLAAARIS